MNIKKLKDLPTFIAGDNSILKEILNPLKEENLAVNYSLAYAVVPPNETTKKHQLTTSEVYFIISGIGEMYINNNSKEVEKGDTIYIPPNAIQNIKNIGEDDLIFLCIVDPAWKKENEIVLE